MKHNSDYFRLFHSKKKNPVAAILSNKIWVAMMLATLMFGCGTTVYNIKSARERSNNKLLTGRFVFYNDGVHIENGEGFTVFFKKERIKHSECFNLMRKDMYSYL